MGRMEEPEFHEHDGRIPGESPESPLLLERLHRAFARWNLRRLRPAHPTRRWRDEIEEDLRMRSLEGEWIEAERSALRPWTREVPAGPAAFLRWFEALVDDGPGHPGSMLDPLAERASLEQARWWMRQELAAEAGLDAMVSLTRLRMPDVPGIAPAAAASESGRFLRLGHAFGGSGTAQGPEGRCQGKSLHATAPKVLRKYSNVADMDDSCRQRRFHVWPAARYRRQVSLP